MNNYTLKFMVDMLNLIFGKSEETNYFWEEKLIPEVVRQFKVDEAIKT